jgi:putative MFS transporter
MEPQTVNAGARLDAVQVGRFHYHVLCLIGLGMFLDAFDIYLAGGVLGSLLKTGWSTLAQNALFVSLTFVGMMIGAFAAGILGDHFGRRATCQINLAVFGLASFAAALAPDMDWLIFFRFVMGIGLGAEVAIGFAIIAEFVPARSRGRWVGAASLIANSALFIASVAGLWIIPNYGWRPMFMIVAVGAAILAYFRRAMPESPRWLERKGRLVEAEALLQRIEAGSPRAGEPAAASEPAAPRHHSITVLFRREVIGRTVLGAFFNITLGICLYGLITWMPTFFISEGLSIAASLLFTTVMSLGGPAGALLGLLLADHLDRRPMMMSLPILAAALALIYPAMTEPAGLMFVGFALVTTIYTWITFGQIFVAESFDTASRLRGTGFSSMSGRLTTALVQFPIIAIFGFGGVSAVVGVVAAFLAAFSTLFFFVGIETRRKSLEAVAPAL